MSEYKIDGLSEFSDKLKKMPAKAGGKALRQSVTFATTPVVKSARANIPVGKFPHKTYKGFYVAPGHAKKQIAKRGFTARSKRYARSAVGVRPDAFYAVNFIELGWTHKGGWTKAQKKRGKLTEIPKQEWLAPAFEANLTQMIGRFKTKMKRVIEKSAKA